MSPTPAGWIKSTESLVNSQSASFIKNYFVSRQQQA